MNGIFFLLAAVLLLPACCTTVGAAGVFLMRPTQEPKTRRMLCGMAAGIMLAASVWSLLLPAIERAEAGILPVWLAPAAGLVLGAVGLLRLEEAAGRLMHTGSKEHGRMGRVVLAVTLHNLPEGMVVALLPRWPCGENRMLSAGRWPLRWASGCRTFRRAQRSACRCCKTGRAGSGRSGLGWPLGWWSRWGRCWHWPWRAGCRPLCPG